MKQFKTSFGALWALLASLIFSINDMLIKFLSDDYALHQIVFTRSLIAVLVMLVIVIPIAGGFSKLKTKRLGLHLLRALFVVAANLFFYMALADLPLATVVSIFFIAPFLITIFSVVFLNEKVGAWRWTTIFVGLLGVLLIVRPGTDAFTLISILPADGGPLLRIIPYINSENRTWRKPYHIDVLCALSLLDSHGVNWPFGRTWTIPRRRSSLG